MKDLLRDLLGRGGRATSELLRVARRLDAEGYDINDPRSIADAVLFEVGRRERRRLDAMQDEQRAVIENPGTGAIPWACDICGGNGLKSNGPEGYCLTHAPGHWDMEFARRSHREVWGEDSSEP